MRRLLVVFGVLALAGLGAWLPASADAHARKVTGTASADGLPPIHHVFEIVLENESASVTFGASSPAPYLSQTLRAQGAYLPNYHGIGHNSLDNYIAMISGQAPNPLTQADCVISFSNVAPTTIGSYGQVKGDGCVYPSSTPTLPGQLQAAGLTWRSYNDSMGADPSREASECGHPAVGTRDGTQTETATDQYAARHDPFVYFHSIIDNTTLCDQNVVNLDQLPHDLASVATTPNYVFITPGLCNDGHNTNCANGDPGGLTQVNTFLQQWVPQILNSPAFKDDNGLLLITFDEAATSDASSCCGEIPGPMSPLPGESGSGGGDTGAVMLSPCIAPGTETLTPYNHYTALRSFEDIFGLSHIGYAQLPGETSFGSDIFTRNCSQTPTEHATLKRAGPKAKRMLKLSWAPTGAAASSYQVQVRRVTPHGTAFKTLQNATSATSLTYRAPRAGLYAFRVRGTGAAGTGAWVTVKLRLR